MTEKRRLQLACLGFGYFATLITVGSHALLQPRVGFPELSVGGALLLFPFVGALAAGWAARWFDPVRFGPLRALVLVVPMFLAVSFVQAFILIGNSSGGGLMGALGLVIVVLAFGGILTGWIALPLALVFGVVYRRHTAGRRRELAGDADTTTAAMNTASTPAPVSTPPVQPGAETTAEVSPPAEPVIRLQPDAEQPPLAPAAAGWPLEDFPQAVVARWGRRIGWLHPILLMAAVAVGLLSGDLTGGLREDPWVLIFATFVVYPVYALLDSAVNAHFYASSLRALSLPLAQGVGSSFVSSHDVMLATALFAICNLAVALLAMTIVRWHRMLQDSERGAGTELASADPWLTRWGPKIGYPYLVVVAMYWLYDEAFNARISLPVVTAIYVVGVMAVAALVQARRRSDRGRGTG